MALSITITFICSAFDNFSCSREGHLLQQVTLLGGAFSKCKQIVGERSLDNFAGQEVQFVSVMLLVLFN